MVVKLDVQKATGGIFWTNRYLLDLADPADVSEAMVLAVVAAERAFHSNGVQFVSARVSDAVPGTDNFYIYPLTGVGSYMYSGGVLAVYQTMRVDIGVGAGRPCRKYYRTFMGEDQTIGWLWEEAYRTVAQNAMNTLIPLVPTLCDPDGNHWVAAAAKSAVQMRQQRRGSRRRTTPVIPVS